MSEAAPTQSLRIGVTLGDPRGVGPEIAAAAAESFRAAAQHELVFIGPAGTPADGGGHRHIAVGEWSSRSCDVATAGRLAGEAIDTGIRLALAGELDALVTAPIDKYALHAGGFDFPGHTEMLAARCGVAEVVMMMATARTAVGGPLRVVLATTHVPLSSVPHVFDEDRLVRQTQITAAGLRAGWGMARPRIGLCAINPHASDSGLFGDEETRIYGPAIVRLRRGGLDVSDPIPADTVFLRAIRGEFDAVIAPYHDVGMAAFKTVSFGHGVNVTLGLPFPRTSPDHGTALDIAGLGRADPSSMHEALMLAARLGALRATRSTTAVT